jgi:hypothetical protein
MVGAVVAAAHRGSDRLEQADVGAAARGIAEEPAGELSSCKSFSKKRPTASPPSAAMPRYQM